MSRETVLATKTAEVLKTELKTWEVAFAKANNGRKPSKEDIRKDGTIGAKYKEYNDFKKRQSRPEAIPQTSARPTPDETHNSALRERSANAITATPRKSDNYAQGQHPRELRTVEEEPEPTPAHIRLALGPTPQKDGAVLGIFDMLSAGTPSKPTPSTTRQPPDAFVAGTPSKPTTSSNPQQWSRTPQSSSKRFLLDAYAGTPAKRKREDGEQGTPGTVKRLFATPSFLRRNWPLGRIGEEDGAEEDQRAARPPFKKRPPLVRSLSTIIQGLKKQEEERMDDEWDVLNELEAEERGEAPAPKMKPAKALVEDSQAQEAGEMPLGPDQSVEESEDDGADDRGALDAEGRPRKVWKKKGLKRQTRRVIMRPVRHKTPAAKPEGKEEGSEAEERVEETQLPDGGSAKARAGKGDEDDFVDSDSGDEERHDSQQSPSSKNKKSAARGNKKAAKDVEKAKAKKDVEKKQEKAKSEMEKEKDKKTKKTKADAHANYRALKIKNKNSKAGGRKFGRR